MCNKKYLVQEKYLNNKNDNNHEEIDSKITHSDSNKVIYYWGTGELFKNLENDIVLTSSKNKLKRIVNRYTALTETKF